MTQPDVSAAGGSSMDHAYIEENSIVERYLEERLPAAERQLFEDHFVACSHCLDALDAAEDFASALRDGIALEVTRQAAQAARKRWWLSGRVLSVALVAAILPLLWLARGSTTTPAVPVANIATYDLGQVRSDDPAAPALEVTASSWFTLLIEAHDEQLFASYQLTVSRGEARVLFHPGLLPDHRDRLSLTFPPDSLAPGSYRVVLHGVEHGALEARRELGSHRIEVVAVR